jgi:hypothetical protein
MHTHFRLIFASLAVSTLLCGCSPVEAQAPRTATPATPAITVATDTDVANTREELLRLLKISPTLTEVVAADPSLLSNQDYVNHNNPELGRFLLAHPEVGRNPDFYLFADLPHNGGSRHEQLERRVWSGRPEPDHSFTPTQRLLDQVGPFLGAMACLAATLWLIRMFWANRRWRRIFQMQTEVHGKLIDKLGSSQELLTYMNTDAGKRFLEAAPIPVDFEQTERFPNAIARVLNPLQIGIVLTLLGVGLLVLRNSLPDISEGLLVLGTVVLMPGIGFMISAGITWMLASRLGLMPGAVDSAFTKERL